MQVYVQPFIWGDFDSGRFEGTSLVVPKSTTIGQLKNMKIFDGGRRNCPPDSFTLKNVATGTAFQDDAVVGLMAYSGDNKLSFDVHYR